MHVELLQHESGNDCLDMNVPIVSDASAVKKQNMAMDLQVISVSDECTTVALLNTQSTYATYLYWLQLRIFGLLQVLARKYEIAFQREVQNKQEER